MDAKELDARFVYHAPKNDQADRYERLRLRGREMAELMCHFCPASRELSTALTKVEEAVMWANAAIARRE